ncbi:MAG TPA: HEAT repeat domain-containing protein [Polyangiaceae bacterium]|jgi:hypothetical protein
MSDVISELNDFVQQQRVRALPQLRRFLEEVAAILGGRGAFLDDCGAPFAALLRDPTFFADLAAHEIQYLQKDPAYFIPLGTEVEIPLAFTKLGRLTLRYLEAFPGERTAPSRLAGMVSNLFIGVFGPGTSAIEAFVEEPPGRVLRRAGVEELRPGEIRRCAAGRDVIHSWLGPKASVWLVFTEAKDIQTSWLYDYATLSPVRQHAPTTGTPRLEYAARLLSELGYKPGVEAIAGLYEHPDHYIRWGALRQLARLDQERALSLLQRAKDDPHPHVRNAAQAALRRFQGEAH